jgi:nucleoside phosphorylase
MKSSFPSIRFGLMVGIGGGVPSYKSDIRLGDVVISQPHMQHGGVVQYDIGKIGTGGKSIRTGSLNAPPTFLLNALSKLQSNHFLARSRLPAYLSLVDDKPLFSRESTGPNIRFEQAYDHVEGATCEKCSSERRVKRASRTAHGVVLHYGTIASGSQVVKDAITRDKRSRELGWAVYFALRWRQRD